MGIANIRRVTTLAGGLAAIGILACLLAATRCTPPETAAPAPRPAKRRPAPPPRPGPGSITGVVRFQGAAPPPLPVKLTGPRANECRAAQAAYEASVKKAPGGGMADVFVMVEGAATSRPARQRSRDLVIEGCVLRPYVNDATVGDTLRIRNADSHAYFCGLGDGNKPATAKQRILPGQTVDFELDRPGGRRIDCSLGHPWLIGHLLVSRHPYHAVTDAAGSFRIDDVPSGGYRVQAWHPSQRKMFTDVRVIPSKNARLEIVYRAVGEPPDGGLAEPSPVASVIPDAGAPMAPDAATTADRGATADGERDAATGAAAAAEPVQPSRGEPGRLAIDAGPSVRGPEPTAADRPPRERALEAIAKGRAALKAGRHAEALGLFTQANDLVPTIPAAYRGLGDANMALHNTRAAIRAYRTYLIANPSALDGAVVRARLRSLGAQQP